jgi:hypothetical protein
MRDAVGNELKVGDLVFLSLDRPQVFGRVIEAAEGGLVTGINHKGGTDVRPGRLVIAANHTIEFDPRQPIHTVLALREDASSTSSTENLDARPGVAVPN